MTQTGGSVSVAALTALVALSIGGCGGFLGGGGSSRAVEISTNRQAYDRWEHG